MKIMGPALGYLRNDLTEGTGDAAAPRDARTEPNKPLHLPFGSIHPPHPDLRNNAITAETLVPPHTSPGDQLNPWLNKYHAAMMKPCRKPQRELGAGKGAAGLGKEEAK